TPVSASPAGGIPARPFIIAVLLCAMLYFPFYRQRDDFTVIHALALAKQNDQDKIDVYRYIVQHIPSDKVILCEEKFSIFPVMATARKTVCVSVLFSNPYLDFYKRFG